MVNPDAVVTSVAALAAGLEVHHSPDRSGSPSNMLPRSTKLALMLVEIGTKVFIVF